MKKTTGTSYTGGCVDTRTGLGLVGNEGCRRVINEKYIYHLDYKAFNFGDSYKLTDPDLIYVAANYN
jgi:hypothetical protein